MKVAFAMIAVGAGLLLTGCAYSDYPPPPLFVPPPPPRPIPPYYYTPGYGPGPDAPSGYAPAPYAAPAPGYPQPSAAPAYPQPYPSTPYAPQPGPYRP